MKISDRLKQIRDKLNLTQPEAGVKFNINPGTWKQYERGPSEPGAGALLGLLNGGININWLLSGNGEMLLSDLEDKSPPSPVDLETLLYVIEGVESHLAQNKLTLKPDRKALLIQLIYEYCSMDTDAKKPGTVERFLKLVA